MERCEQCGYDYEAVPPTAVADELRALPPRYERELLAAVDAGLARERPQPEVWSALEYTCHVRDVLVVQRERLALAMREERPELVPMRRDERAVEERYNEQQAEVVLADLSAAAERLADDLELVSGEQWDRTGIYPWPERTERSTAWLARHTLHEGLHHLHDLVRGVRALRAAP